MRGLASLCSLLGYTRQSYYKHQQCQQKEVLETELIIQQVVKIREQQPRIGTRKLEFLLQGFMLEHRLSLGRDAFFDLLRDHNLLVRRRKRKAQTTYSKHWMRKYPNIIRGFEPIAPNCLWVSDITYIIVAEGFAYLSLVTDAYSRKIIGHKLSPTLAAKGSIAALKLALKDLPDDALLIHHSDRGVQYCCSDYVSLLQARHIVISMTEKGDPLENAIAERVNGILKEELLQSSYRTFEEARLGVARAISVYNNMRPHSSCDMLTPQQAHRKTGPLKKRWKNYYQSSKKEVEMSG